MVNKVLLSFSVGIIITIGVYFALTNSLTRPSINRIAISEDTAKLVVMRLENKSSEDIKYLSGEYVYIRGNGSVYQSNPDNNDIGKFIENLNYTITGGNHFTWKIRDNLSKTFYFIDHVNGQLVSKWRFE